jgi:hypothetical protein
MTIAPTTRRCAALTTLAVLLPLALLAPLAACASPQPARAPVEPGAADAALTVAEASGYTRTARYEEVVDFLEQLEDRSESVRLTSMGRTVEGRDIPVAILADPPVASAREARADERLTVLLFGNIHAGEVAGKEALLMLARELALEPDHPLLDHLIVCIAPIYNADGNERMAPDNRPGQDGPEEMGIRANAQGLDLNRDYIKLEAPETVAMISFCNEWDPALIADMHTTNGSLHRYTLTYQGPKHPAGGEALLEYVRDQVLPRVDAMFEAGTGYDSFVYGNFTSDHQRWVTYPAEPNYGAPYRGIRNRIGVLVEAYAYAPYRDRVISTLGYCRSLLRYAAEHRSALRRLVAAADARTTAAGKAPFSAPTVPLRVRAEPFDRTVRLKGYESARSREGLAAAGEPREHDVLLVNDFVPTLEVRRPWAYVIPPDLEEIARHLRLHGVRVDRLVEEADAALETYELHKWRRAERSFQGHRMIRDVQVRTRSGRSGIEQGSFIVRTGQPLGSLAAYMLEPQASSGLTAWNFFDRYLIEGEDFPVRRMTRRAGLPLRLEPWSP